MTRDRIYIETMQQIYTNSTKVLVDSRQGNNLLYLPLDKLMAQSQGGTPGSGTAQAPAAGAAARLPRRKPAAIPGRASCCATATAIRAEEP
ncbi:hypothetical protein ACU4GD_39980 [Cupriavidus basilensis]